AVTAHADGIALRWNSCEGSANRNFACDRSTGSELLVGSFQAPAGINQLSGIQVYLRIVSANNTVPPWWTMSRGGCRTTGMSISFDMSDQMECTDPWEGQAMGGLARYEADGSGAIDVLIGAAVPQSALRALDSGRTYAAFKLLVNHQRSSGGGACEGCTTPMCLRFEAIRLVEPGRLYADGHRDELYHELNRGISGLGGSANIATWQGGASNCTIGGSKPATWRQLKDLYRSR
ncbi:MAG: hypothetical protein RL760_576, partial [Candidatus Eisenbacteria bacterium]